jgi:hypothetical protein
MMALQLPTQQARVLSDAAAEVRCVASIQFSNIRESAN